MQMIDADDGVLDRREFLSTSRVLEDISDAYTTPKLKPQTSSLEPSIPPFLPPSLPEDISVLGMRPLCLKDLADRRQIP